MREMWGLWVGRVLIATLTATLGCGGGGSDDGAAGSAGASGSSGAGGAGGAGGTGGAAQGGGTGGGSAGVAGSVSFDERCADPSVVACWGFDTKETTDPYLNDSGFSPPEHDTVMFAEGAGSVHMRVEAGSGPDTSGSFVLDFSPGFGEGQTLYVQWRQRFTESFLSAPFGGYGWKQMLVHENTSTAGCSDSEVVVTNYNDANFPIAYHACNIFESPVENPVDGDIYEFNYQPGGDNRCLWSWMDSGIDHLEPTDDLDETACVGYLPDQWITFQLAVHLNEWCTLADYEACPEDSRFQLWVTYEGQPPALVTDWPMALRTTTDPATTLYDSLQFTPYHTNKDPSVNHAPGELWYDSVIVSSTRIAEP